MGHQTAGDIIFESSNSIIYRQKEIKNEKTVILKVLRDPHPSPQKIAQFNNEYELTKNLEIPGVRRALELTKVNGHRGIILEYFAGIPVRDYFCKNKITLKEFLASAIKIAEALGAVHAQNIIHRDIGGGNILVHPESGDIKIIDFGISSRIDLRIEHGGNPESLEGTLVYMSPEQTGRMNRVVDYRTDMYSLGVTFYEALAGAPPFKSNDAMTLVHAHIARPPLSLCDIPASEIPGKTRIPPGLSGIISRLLEKNAEDRYQSARGLKADLEFALKQLSESSQIETFDLGQNDYSARISPSQNLYGREKELETLLKVYSRTLEGRAELLLVGGYSGVGKSSLVHELYKKITAKNGNFISGKFEQYRRNLPFLAFSQAIGEFCGRLLTEEEEDLKIWKEKISEALGKNGRVLCEMVPELEAILGNQGPVPELAPQENKNRFLLVFNNFVRAISSKQYPLVIFIDDLQWADIASLELLESLMSDSQIMEPLLIVCAFRDNEVDEAHPLTFSLEKLKKRNKKFEQVSLGNLGEQDLDRMLADCLRCDPAYSKPLSELIYQKTHGNAFFARAFIRSLYEAGLLTFSFGKCNWVWELEEIKKKDLSDNVVDLMMGKLKTLNESTRTTLELAACIGGRFSLSALAMIDNQNPRLTLENLWEAILEGLILPLDQNYKIPETVEKSHFRFLHDRVQQAAYSMIPIEDRGAVHLRIGRLLLRQFDGKINERDKSVSVGEDEVSDMLFEITNHLNEGRVLIRKQEELMRLIRLNINAGKKARGAAAYDSARGYLEQARQLLVIEDQEGNPGLCFEIYVELGEMEYVIGNGEVGMKYLYDALTFSSSTLELTRVYATLINQQTLLGNFSQAIDVSVKALNELGMNIPPQDREEEIQRIAQAELSACAEKMQELTLEEIFELPLMEDEQMRSCTQILCASLNAGVLGGSLYWQIYSSRITEISLKYGISEYTAYGYAIFSYIYSGHLGDYPRAARLSELAFKVNQEKAPLPALTPILMISKLLYLTLSRPLEEGRGVAQELFRYSREVGDALSASYSIYWVMLYLFPLDLEETIVFGDKYILYNMERNDVHMLALIRPLLGLGRRLRSGDELITTSLDYAGFDESEFLEKFQNDQVKLTLYYEHKLKIIVLTKRYEEALKIIETRASWGTGVTNINAFCTGEIMFFMGLAAIGLLSECDSQTDPKRQDLRACLFECILELRKLAGINKSNYEHGYLILQARKAQVDNQPREAMKCFEDAAQSARKHNYTMNEYLANRLAGEFYLELRIEKFAAIYFSEALYVAGRWGAGALEIELNEKYGALIRKVSYSRGISSGGVALTGAMNSSTSIGSTTSGASLLDISTVLKASRALSREINLEKLLTRMMELILENAGASRGFLLLESGGELRIEAALEQGKRRVGATGVWILQSQALRENKELSHSIVRYVARSGESQVIHDASLESRAEGRIVEDEYIRAKNPRSILCMPVLHQDKVQGVLYLENNLSAGAFTEERTELLHILLAQAAISLENAKVYDKLEELVKERTAELEKTHKQLLETAHRAGMAEVAAGVLHNVGNALNSALTPASLIREELGRSRVTSLKKLAELLNEQEDLAVFVGEDERGQKLPVYLERLYEILEEEKDGIGEKLERLTKSLGRIKEVIRLQQSYAGTTLLEEELSLEELVQDALAINGAEYEELGIEVKREFSEIKPIKSDRHRLMLILMNLLSNARDALVGNKNRGAEAKQIRLIIEETEEGRVVIRVEDNGEGIESENLDKIFRNGFSTRKGEGGFGLHNSANAATELGGRLRVESAGPDKGASFSLELFRETSVPKENGAKGAPPARDL